MSAEQWFEMLNSVSEEELEQIFVGMCVSLVQRDGKIVRVINHAT